ncbi:MerR family transcriptional regulator [Kutzneria sp. CA-103260]|uniref:MerR family transcriptional regulator n=1 Tax=Kutzneria sp. CA-103260 TaxID=2802641 RepID=UPI001BAA9C3D|nr:MerR family transcriptional regulator [Kutzneria sp. CA-103260]QUQ68661.1 MerR family transcriptional regulator [Kutzneria sp. CA-103260]
MAVLLPIGDFSRMTYLSVKALRHYHDVGLLLPAVIDPVSGHRLYRPEQARTAQVIRRFRDLGMPLEEVRAVLAAPDVAGRNAVIGAHLRRVEEQLERTQAAVTSLRLLLEQGPPAIEVEYRSVPAMTVLAVRDRIAMSDCERWWGDAFGRLHAAVGDHRVGPDGCLYHSEFFTDDAGDVLAFVPVDGEPSGRGDVEPFEIPAVELAVTLHQGPFSELDQTYGALGTYVAERAIGADGPIREHYLASPTETEVCWPVRHTTD